MKDLTEIPLTPDLRLVSFDIENMYSDIQTDELSSIIKSMFLEQNLDENITTNLWILHTPSLNRITLNFKINVTSKKQD
jgi:hypothetical protein